MKINELDIGWELGFGRTGEGGLPGEFKLISAESICEAACVCGAA